VSPAVTRRPSTARNAVLRSRAAGSRLAFFLDVVTAISDEGPSMAIGHHVGPEVAAIDMANCDSAAVAIDAPRFAGDVALAVIVPVTRTRVPIN